MCLGIPGKVVETYREHDMLMGKVDFRRRKFKHVCLEHVPHVKVGEYVIVHVAGFASELRSTKARPGAIQHLDEMSPGSDERPT